VIPKPTRFAVANDNYNNNKQYSSRAMFPLKQISLIQKKWRLPLCVNDIAVYITMMQHAIVFSLKNQKVFLHSSSLGLLYLWCCEWAFNLVK